MEICDKKLLRREGMARRRGLTAGQRQEKSAAIAERLIHAELFRQAESVFCYISMENEVHRQNPDNQPIYPANQYRSLLPDVPVFR